MEPRLKLRSTNIVVLKFYTGCAEWWTPVALYR